MMGWPAKARRGSRISLHSCSRVGMYCEGTWLSMPCLVAVALLSNSDNEKCFESFIMI